MKEDTEEVTTVFDGTYGGAGGGARPTVSMSMGDSVSTCFRKGLSLGLFKGRASRSEYNWFLLLYVICNVGIAWMMIDTIIQQATLDEMMDGRYYVESDLSTPSPVFCLVLIPLEIAYLGVLVRRLHDLGFTGWVILVTIVPMIGPIAALVFGLICIFGEGQGEENKYGPVPTNTVEKSGVEILEEQ
tara:strand:+ start:1099 stop:1659 length:561 start_codon:yes stop_codon:yes gene_type:complete